MKHFAMVVILLGVGYGLGWFVSNHNMQAELERQQAEQAKDARSSLDGLETSLNDKSAEFDRLNADYDSLQRENKELLAKVDELNDSVNKLRQAEALVKATAEADEAGLALSYGEFGDLDALLNADWDQIGSAMLNLREGILAILAKVEAGEEVGQEDWMALQEHNMHLVGFALSMNGKLPTHGQINGVFTHPLAQVNMMSEMLAGAEVALSDDQTAMLEQLGLQFENDWDQMNGEYGDGALALEKLLDEADLKREFLATIEDGLTPEQRDIIFPEASRNVNMLDLFSPVLMFSETGRPMMVSSEEDMRSQMLGRAASALGMTTQELDSQGHVFDRWVEDVRDIMNPVSGDEAMFYDLETGLTAGRAQVAAVQALADALDLPEDKRKELLENKMFFVPRLIQQQEGEDTPADGEG